ncbi:Sigma-adaptin 3A [Malassezia sp. CBS 17886]|nr:Sigma-adaptin 3A [Malassezia sp. CBS 17886]
MHEPIDTVSPTFGFSIKTFVHRGYALRWDVGGQRSLRPYWRNYFEKTDAVVWVVDSTDAGRLDDCRAELGALLSVERLAGASLLIFANKQDIPGAMSPDAIRQHLRLDEITSHSWRIQRSSAVTGENADSVHASYVYDLMTIRAALIINNYGRPRLTKFYSRLSADQQQDLIHEIFQLVSRRDDRTVCNFLDGPELTPLLPPPTDDAWVKLRGIAPHSTASGDVSLRNASAEEDEALEPRGRRGEGPRTETPGTNRRWQPDDELRVIYRHYATLYFVLVVDQSESELGILDLIQVRRESSDSDTHRAKVIVEALDRCFENVCELDLIFHFDEVHVIIDQIIQGGLVLETNINEIVTAAQEVLQARRLSASSGSGTGALAALNAAQSASAFLAPQALQWSNVSVGALAERGSGALSTLQQLRSQYWSARGDASRSDHSAWG